MAQRQTGRENLVNAVIEFSAILSAKERNTLTQTNTITDILDLTKALQDARVSRNKIKQCAAFLQSVQQFSSVVDTMIQFTPAISTMVWGSSTILLLTAQIYVQYFSAIIDLLERLGLLCPIFKEFQDLWPHYLGLQDAVFEYYAQVVFFCTDAIKYLRRSRNSKILKSFLPPVKDELQDVEKKLIFQQKIVEYQIILAKEDTARKARQQQILFNVNWEAHKDVELQEWAKTRDFELKQKFQKKIDARQQLLKQISDYNHTTMFLEFMKGSHPRTGEWLYEMGEFKEWVQSHHSSLLWCHGISGSGKSVLSTSVVKHLMDTCLQQTTYEPGKTFIGYFFCTFSDYHSLVFEVIIRSLIKQILSVFHGSAEFEEYLAKFFNQCNNIPSVHQWQKLFIRTCSLPNHIYLILDGVDECHDDIQAQILELLNEMLSIPRSIKIYLSSRKEVYLARNLTHAISISLDDVKWRPEIEGYIDESLRQRLNDGRLQIEDPTMVEEIKQALMVGAEGMFRWVTLQLYDVCRQLNDEEIREALRSLPRDLDEIYIRMLQRIIKEYKKDIAVEAFRWLTRARRQLSLRELVEAVVIRDEDTVRAQGLNRIPTDLGKVIEACGDFLVIEEPVCDSSTVRFIHSSVVTFLHKYKLPVQLEVFRMEPQTTEAHLAKRCLQYLHFQDLQTKNANLKVFSRTSAMGADTDAATSQMHKSTLYDYVIKNWLSHCQKLPTTSGSSMDEKQYWTWFRNLVFNGFNSIKFPWPSDSPSTVDYPHHELFKWAVQNSHQALIQLIFQEVASVGITPPQYVDGFLVWASAGTKYQCLVSEMPLLVSAALGFPYLISFYLSKGSQLDFEFHLQETGENQTALMAASRSGHLTTVEHILQVGAKLNHNSEYLRKALHSAFTGDHLLIFERLVLAGAPVDWNSLLIEAANAGKLRFVCHILERGDFTAETLSESLNYAALNGHAEILKQLLEANDDPSRWPKMGSSRSVATTVLYVAAGHDHAEAVRVLLAAGAELNSLDESGKKTPLHCAVEGGHVDVVKELVAAGGEVNIRNQRAETPLHRAAEGGHVEIVKQLLAAEAEVNIGDQHGKTPLHFAAQGCHIDIVEQLLAAEAEVNVHNKRGETPLYCATEGGHVMIVRKLLVAGAQVNSTSEFEETPLHRATEGGHVKIIKRLLAAGAEINSMNEYGETPLHRAAEANHVEAVKQLLAAGAKVSKGDEHGETALHYAAELGHVEVVEQLLAAGAEINKVDKVVGKTPLHCAAEEGHVEILKRLLAAGAEVNSMNVYGETPLHRAAEGDHAEVVEQLLAAGAKLYEVLQ